MINIRRSQDRGHADHGWLNTYHTFSFADYHDPAHRGFRALRVINEDWVQPGQGFGMHDHRDMEIVTYILEGELEHRDSMGNGEVLRAGELQHMTAGSGIMHSEFNPSKTNPVHLYQIWLFPDKKGLPPSYEQRAVDLTKSNNRWLTVASPDGRESSLTIHQDATLQLATLAPNAAVQHEPRPGREAWLQVLRGEVSVNGQALSAGDGAAISEEKHIDIAGTSPAQILLFDLA